MSYKKYIKNLQKALYGMWERGMIDKPDKFAAYTEIEKGVDELEKAFTQELKDEHKPEHKR